MNTHTHRDTSTVPPNRAEPPLVLALDVGTSSCRAGLYDVRARRVAEVGCQLQYTPRTTADGGAELDAEVLVELVGQTIDGLARAGAALEGVRVVATCTFWHSLLGIDERGRATSPVYLWLDARGRRAAAALKGRLDERAVHARTGCVLHWSYWPAKLVWLQETPPDLVGRVRRWISFGEYLGLRLCGRGGVSVSMASGTGLLNQHTADWDGQLLAALPIEPGQLAEVVRGEGAASLRPEFAARWPALRGAGWRLAVGDGACSNLGAGCTTRERLALMVGTSGALRGLWRVERFTIPWGVWCYRADAERVVMGGAINDGGSLLAWLRATLRLPDRDRLDQQVAALEPDAHGLTILPFWGGERSPGWAADARGAITGLRLHTSPIEIWRASLEAIALTFGRLAGILHSVIPEAGEVIATGGALLPSPAWLQIMADVLGRPVLASPEPEASSRGAALLALESFGAFPDGLEALAPSTERVYEPLAAHTERYRAAAERYARLYDALV